MINSYGLNLSPIQLTSFIFCLFLLNPVQAEWKSGVELPERSKWNGQSDIFNPIIIANNRLTYIAATSTNPIPWKITKGESAYLLIYLPPGVEKLNMGINGQALAASQLVMFKDFGEMSCNNITKPASPQLSEFLDQSKLVVNLPIGWKALGDSRTAAHERNQGFINTSSCLFFGFFNANNLNQAGIQLQDVGFTYTISDLSVYKGWAAGNKKLTINSENGKVTITNNLNTDSKVCPDDCTPTDYPADTEVTLKAVANDGYVFDSWQGDKCTDKDEDKNKTVIKITMDNDKTCSAKFKPIPVTLEIKNENDGLNGGLIASYITNIYDNNYILCGSLISNFDYQFCTAEYNKQTVEVLIAMPKHGFILESWGNNTTAKENYIIFDGKNPQTYSPKFIPIN